MPHSKSRVFKSNPHHLANVETTSLKFKNRSTRRRSEHDVATAIKYIQTTRICPPLIADADGTVHVGELWLAAARQLGLSQVPVMSVAGLTDAQKIALEIGYHKILENENWDEEALKDGIQVLYELDCEFDFDAIGFAPQQIDILVSTDPATAAENDVGPVVDTRPAVSKVGDMWILGSHLLKNGSATAACTYTSLVEDRKIRMVFTDPPYNVKTQGHIGGSGKTKHREFVQAAGEMSAEEFTKFLFEFLVSAIEHLLDGALLYICMDFRHMKELLGSAEAAELVMINLCVWCKNNGGMGSHYRSQHELVFVFRKGKASHVNNIELGKHGRYRTNVWHYDGVNTFRNGRMDELSMHPTVKPVAMVADAILDSSKRGEYVLDCFAGSGTIFIACEKTGRKGLGIELDPLYVDVAIRRWEKWTGREAIHAQTGQTFKEREANPQPLLALPPPRSRERRVRKGGNNV